MRRRAVVGRAGAVVGLVLAAVAGLLFGGAGAAAADSGYRYWSFWTWDRSGERWSYATQGPASLRPVDGAVVGFRFAVSEDSADATTPRGPADFAAVCGDTAEEDGRKRVALVIDPGTRADAPAGETPPARRTECAVVAPDASAADALAAVAPPLRYDSSALLCAIAGYPRSGCGERVAVGGERGPADGGKSDGGGVPLWLGGVVLVVLAGGAVWQVRRRRS
ncbi:SCO2322 family protein [Streptomyces alkaliterrae]|uniref:SCO2322 family protein n=1 Tax=Streptomyces alkaliterrae TaxID=2213162 RepID=UPI002B1F4DCA|nr:SCO2322 family protein [Streptomyces alkaliterrae]